LLSYHCPYDPRKLAGQAIGMLHCPECGVMVLGGVAHPPVRRYRPRLEYDDPIVDITDQPWLWSDQDHFDYDIPD
jgi:hypothetical protein